MIGIEAIKVWKKMHGECAGLLKKEKANLEKAKDSKSIHEVRLAESRVDAVLEEMSILERKILKSWTDGE